MAETNRVGYGSALSASPSITTTSNIICIVLGSFPGSPRVQATESWAGPGNEASIVLPDKQYWKIQMNPSSLYRYYSGQTHTEICANVQFFGSHFTISFRF